LDLWKWGRNRPWGLNPWEHYDDDIHNWTLYNITADTNLLLKDNRATVMHTAQSKKYWSFLFR
jgi:hypothetical protein